MSKPIWHSAKKGAAREEFVAFAAGRDVVPITEADAVLIPYDLWTNRAHAIGLQKIDLFSQKELASVIKALNQLEGLHDKGQWRLDPKLEDVHINIEAYVSQQCGEEVGGKLHSGRSRNDQVANDMKLLARDTVLEFMGECLQLVSSLLEHAALHTEAVMPGYTHHRKATLTSWGHYCASYAQGLLRDAERWQALLNRINTCPLGAAASYGTTWPLDRDLTADLMAYDRAQENTLDAVMSRGEAETEIVQAAALMLKRLSTVSQDLILFSTDEFGFLKLPSDFTTGSSIMPQKRNPDFAEAIKGKANLVFGFAQSLLAMNGCNFSGYNKDVQWSKYVFLDAVRESSGACRILADVFKGLLVNAERMEQTARSGFLNAVDIADHLARSRELAFRKTYRLISDAVGLSKDGVFALDGLNSLLAKGNIRELTTDEFENLNNPRTCLLSRNHVGSPHPRQVKKSVAAMQKQASKLEQWRQGKIQYIQDKREQCKRV